MLKQTLKKMIERLKKDEELTYEDVVDEFLDKIPFEQLLSLIKDFKDEEDFQDELKDVVYPYLLGKLEDKFEEEV